MVGGVTAEILVYPEIFTCAGVLPACMCVHRSPGIGVTDSWL